MRVPGSIYNLNGRTYILTYAFQPDVYRAPLPSIAGKAKYVAHTTYTHGKTSAAIDAFYLSKEIKRPPPELDLKRWGRIRGDIKNVDPAYNVRRELISSFPRPLKEELKRIERSDILTFCKEKNYREADNPGNTQIGYVKKIIPRTKFGKPKKPKKPKPLLSTGKELFVNFYSEKDGSLKSCLYQASIDVASGCPSGFVPLDDNARFDSKSRIFTGFFLNPFAECAYPCYKGRNHKTFPKSLFNINKNKLKEELTTGKFGAKIKTSLGHPVEILRIAKNTEAGSKYTLDSLKLIAETCCETGTRPFLITKYLKYDRDITKLWKRSNGILSYTYGFDHMEMGACLHGCNNEFRREQAREYKKNGLDVMLTVLIDGSEGIDKRLEDIIKFSDEQDIRLQLLPLRVWGIDSVMKTVGKSWEDLKTSSKQGSFFGDKGYGYSIVEGSGGSLVCHELHPQILELVGDNKGPVKLCHHDSQDTFCGGCGFSDGDKGKTKHVKIEYKVKKRRRKKKGEDMTIPLFEHI